MERYKEGDKIKVRYWDFWIFATVLRDQHPRSDNVYFTYEGEEEPRCAHTSCVVRR
jgi:hypothetical protein